MAGKIACWDKPETSTSCSPMINVDLYGQQDTVLKIKHQEETHHNFPVPRYTSIVIRTTCTIVKTCTVVIDKRYCMYVCIYVCMVITYSKGKDQPGKVANPARGQLDRGNNISMSAFAPENLVSRDGFGSPVPRQPAHLHAQAESGAYLRDFSLPRRRPFRYLFKPPNAIGSVPSSSVTQLGTDGVHCRESTGTGPVNLKVVSNGCCLGR